MLFRNTRVYPIQIINESGMSIMVPPSGTCDIPEHVGQIYNSILEPIYLDAPRVTPEVFVIEAIPSIEEGMYIDESQVEVTEAKRGRGRPKKG